MKIIIKMKIFSVLTTSTIDVLCICVSANALVSSPLLLVLRGISQAQLKRKPFFFLRCWGIVNQPRATHKQSDQTTNISLRRHHRRRCRNREREKNKNLRAFFFSSFFLCFWDEGVKKVLMVCLYEM